MTSLITEYRSTEESIRELQARLDSLKDNPKLKAEIEFESKLKELMATYDKSLRDVVAILDPASSAIKAAKSAGAPKGSRKERQVKIYKNPHNGETVETKGGNHRTLKAWKTEHGAAAVEGWLQK
ncbi:DNA binding protein [Pseudomonas sp. P66]|uniref:DNA binding protein n=2 Tax=Pseudomonas arcuscaelestis TaxID=2710591 RepID=A0ABS2BZF4_9PSED|nr:histone-like nucleoid-structuring protein, MvaT/MvaU family [Pseudomonas arcuscaelestis]MBM5459012.1 DNA binding protein [Pseudomonas arcuscaelestis]